MTARAPRSLEPADGAGGGGQAEQRRELVLDALAADAAQRPRRRPRRVVDAVGGLKVELERQPHQAQDAQRVVGEGRRRAESQHPGREVGTTAERVDQARRPRPDARSR